MEIGCFGSYKSAKTPPPPFSYTLTDIQWSYYYSTHHHSPHAQATSSARRGQLESAQSNEKISIGCSIAAIVFGVVGTLAIVGGVMAWYFTLFFRF